MVHRTLMELWVQDELALPAVSIVAKGVYVHVIQSLVEEQTAGQCL